MKQLYTVKEITDILKSYGYKFDEKENIKGGISLWFTGTDDSWNKLKNDKNKYQFKYYKPENIGIIDSRETLETGNVVIEKQRNGVFVRINKTNAAKLRQSMGVDYDYDMNEDINADIDRIYNNMGKTEFDQVNANTIVTKAALGFIKIIDVKKGEKFEYNGDDFIMDTPYKNRGKIIVVRIKDNKKFKMTPFTTVKLINENNQKLEKLIENIVTKVISESPYGSQGYFPPMGAEQPRQMSEDKPEIYKGRKAYNIAKKLNTELLKINNEAKKYELLYAPFVNYWPDTHEGNLILGVVRTKLPGHKFTSGWYPDSFNSYEDYASKEKILYNKCENIILHILNESNTEIYSKYHNGIHGKYKGINWESGIVWSIVTPGRKFNEQTATKLEKILGI